jgi:hypothetical protein
LLQIGNSLEAVEQYEELCPIDDTQFSDDLISTRDVEESFIQAIEKMSAPAFELKEGLPVPAVEISTSSGESSSPIVAMSIANMLS